MQRLRPDNGRLTQISWDERASDWVREVWELQTNLAQDALENFGETVIIERAVSEMRQDMANRPAGVRRTHAKAKTKSASRDALSFTS